MKLRKAYSPSPVSLKVLRLVEFLAFNVFKRCSTDQDLKESYAERPDVGFAGIMYISSRPLGRKVLDRDAQKVTNGIMIKHEPLECRMLNYS